MPDRSSHSSTVHFSHTGDPLRLYFQTWDGSSKYTSLRDGTNTKASVVIGFSEEHNITLQMRGGVRIISDPKELEEVYLIHYKKIPTAEKHKSPHTIFIEFTPTWWRYTDLNTKPETILTS